MALVVTSSYSWGNHCSSRSCKISVPTSRSMAVDALSLESLGNDHAATGQALKRSVQKWLDTEFIPQQVHVQMAESCEKSYLASRLSGNDDLMTVMIQVAEDLLATWKEYDDDAFVNAWDISNYVSDYLTAQTGNEGCECSSKLY